MTTEDVAAEEAAYFDAEDDTPRTTVCRCERGTYNSRRHSSCYECFLERRADFMTCIWCGRWHSPKFPTCFLCRAEHPDRQEAGADLRRMVLARDRFQCRQCGSDEQLQVDHMKPCAEGGTADPWNLQTLCGRCNRRKGATWWDGSKYDRDREVSLHAYATYLWQYLTPDEQQRLWAEIEDWLDLNPKAVQNDPMEASA